jgi:hypothetical protein
MALLTSAVVLRAAGMLLDVLRHLVMISQVLLFDCWPCTSWVNYSLHLLVGAKPLVVFGITCSIAQVCVAARLGRRAGQAAE